MLVSVPFMAFRNEKTNAAFRYALVRLRDASEAVAFYRGEVAERTGLRKLFAPIVANYKRYVNRLMGFYGWNLSMSQIIVVPPTTKPSISSLRASTLAVSAPTRGIMISDPMPRGQRE